MQKLSNQTILDTYNYIAMGVRSFDERFIAAIREEIIARGILPPSEMDAAKYVAAGSEEIAEN